MQEVSTRRSFLVGAGAAALAAPATFFPAVAAAQGAAGGLRRSTFAPLVGTTFRMTSPSWSAAAVLRDVAPLVSSRGPHDDDRFSLLFRCDPAVPALQGVYRLTSPRLGAVDVFAVPVGRVVDARSFEVIVHRA